MSTDLGDGTGVGVLGRSLGASEATRGMLSETIGAALGVRPERLAAPSRGTARIAFARQVAIYLARTRLGLSFTEAGRLFGRDRTTAAHACRRIEECRDDASVDRLIEGLDRMVEIAARRVLRQKGRP